jgi:hypothetical protein
MMMNGSKCGAVRESGSERDSGKRTGDAINEGGIGQATDGNRQGHEEREDGE